MIFKTIFLLTTAVIPGPGWVGLVVSLVVFGVVKYIDYKFNTEKR